VDCPRVFEVGPNAADEFGVEPDLIAGHVGEHFGPSIELGGNAGGLGRLDVDPNRNRHR
jgi:hypothetical protein